MNCFRRAHNYQKLDGSVPDTPCLKIRQLEALERIVLQEQKQIYLRELKKREYSNAHIRNVIENAENIEDLNMFWKLVTADD